MHIRFYWKWSNEWLLLWWILWLFSWKTFALCSGVKLFCDESFSDVHVHILICHILNNFQEYVLLCDWRDVGKFFFYCSVEAMIYMSLVKCNIVLPTWLSTKDLIGHAYPVDFTKNFINYALQIAFNKESVLTFDEWFHWIRLHVTSGLAYFFFWLKL